VNTGYVLAGNVGGGGRLEFSVIGDAVNVAARVEACTRETGDAILVTEPTQESIGEGGVEFEERSRVELKGKREPVALYAPRVDGGPRDDYIKGSTIVYMSRDTVGVRDLRQNLSRYLDRARNGERVVVTERNRPIAVLAPLPENEDPLARLIAEGEVIPAERPLVIDEIEPVELDDPDAGSKALEEMREEPDYGLCGAGRCFTSMPRRSSSSSQSSASPRRFGPPSRAVGSSRASSSWSRSHAPSVVCEPTRRNERGSGARSSGSSRALISCRSRGCCSPRRGSLARRA